MSSPHPTSSPFGGNPSGGSAAVASRPPIPVGVASPAHKAGSGLTLGAIARASQIAAINTPMPFPPSVAAGVPQMVTGIPQVVAPAAAPVAPGMAQTATVAPLDLGPIPSGGGGYSSPVSGQVLARFVKICISATIALVIAYVFMKQALPVMMELAKPNSQQGNPAAGGAVGVQMIRNTRDVVAKNNVNVALVDAIADGVDLPAEPKAPAPAAPAAPPAPKAPEVKVNLKAANRAIDDLVVSGVTGGENPRIIVGGMLVRAGEVVDWRLGLVFEGVDEAGRALLFRHKDGTVLRRPY